MRRFLLAAMAATIGAVVLIETADAAPKKRKYYGVSAARLEYERARADAVDPARTYGAYPDWARFALSPKNDGGRSRR
jgi:hypothetical protein